MLTFLDISEICSIIQRLYSYNLLTDKLFGYTDQKKKRKRNRNIGNELSIERALNAHNYKSSLSFCAGQKKIVEFYDSAHTIYWPTNTAKKAASCWKISFYMSVLNLFQYK